MTSLGTAGSTSNGLCVHDNRGKLDSQHAMTHRKKEQSLGHSLLKPLAVLAYVLDLRNFTKVAVMTVFAVIMAN
jgi:hypothetical protein